MTREAPITDLRVRARAKVKRALESGRLVRGKCEFRSPHCSGRIEAHHDDYSQPLEVRWICVFHHRRLDSATRGQLKTATKSARRLPALIPQPGGKGALLAGGVPGNAGGTGRPPAAIRASMRDLLDGEVLPKLATDFRAGELDPMEFAKLLGTFGLGTTKEVSVDAVKAKVEAMLNVLKESLEPALYHELLPKLRQAFLTA